MKIAYLDLFSGLSGDITLGALVDAGLPLAELKRGLSTIGLRGWSLSSTRVMRGAIRATKVDVTIGGKKQKPVSHAPHPPAPDPAHSHDPSAGHAHGHPHGRSPRGDLGHGPDHGHTTLREILGLLRKSGLPAEARRTAAECFQRLGEVEGKIHGIPTPKVRFHEVGAIDSIVDIAGACLGFHLLGIQEVYCSRVPVAHGVLHSQHGLLPNPGPAAVELLRGFPLVPADIPREILTPTGAALLATLVRDPGRFPEMTLREVGWGAGGWDLSERANVARILIGERAAPEESDSVWLVETNLDNVSGELVGYLFDRLLDAGAVDVFTTPIQMKKSRPGVKVSVLVPPTKRASVEAILLRETPTFGVRRALWERSTLGRRWVSVSTPWGPIRCKVGTFGGKELKAAPEYEDVRAAAERHGVPLSRVQEAALRAYRTKKR